MNLKNIFKPWILVSTGILFNILAAVITHYFIDQNNQKLDLLIHQAAQFETLIESQWRMKTELDRSQEFLLILLTLRDQATKSDPDKINGLVAQQLEDIIQQQNIQAAKNYQVTTIDYDTITSTMEMARNNIITRINDTYLDKINIESQQSPIKQRNSLLFSAAIFLQLTGLILVLSRDLKIN